MSSPRAALGRLLAQLDRERLAHELALRPLPAEAIAAMIRAIFNQAAPVSGEFVAAMTELTGGNPFFVEEVLQSLVNAGDIYQVDGRWDRKRLPEIQAPRSVRDAVRRRMARLDPAARRALDAVQQLGRPAPVELLRAAAQMHETLGEWDAARERYEQALRASRALGDARAEWQRLVELGFLPDLRGFPPVRTSRCAAPRRSWPASAPASASRRRWGRGASLVVSWLLVGTGC